MWFCFHSCILKSLNFRKFGLFCFIGYSMIVDSSLISIACPYKRYIPIRPAQVVHNSRVLLLELFYGYYNIRNTSIIVPCNLKNTYFCRYCFVTQGPDINNTHFQELCLSVGCILQQRGVMHKDQIASVGRCISNLSEACPQLHLHPQLGSWEIYTQKLWNPSEELGNEKLRNQILQASPSSG